MKKYFLLFLFIFALSINFSLLAADFGLAVNANGGYENALQGDNSFDYKIDILPRFSALIGENGEFVLSAGFSVGKDGDSFYVPELLRTEFNIRFGNSGVRAGRVNYSDPLSFIANGLFDGIQFYNNSEMGSFRIGAWYTGLQYKKRANIIMTQTDQNALFVPFDYGNFSNTYFASKRAFISIEWEHPSIGEFMQFNAAIIGQTDLNDADVSYHNQYLIIKAGIPINNFLMEFGGSVELAQTVADESKFNLAFAGDFGFYLLFPSQFNSRVSFTGTIASGRKDDSYGAFTPITSKEYGYILKSKISGLSVFSINYSSMFNNSFSGSFTASYFVRNDLGTYCSYPASAGGKGYFLGPEVSARITWGPASDLQLNAECGAFFPFLGNAGSKEKILFRVDLTVTILIF